NACCRHFWVSMTTMSNRASLPLACLLALLAFAPSTAHPALAIDRSNCSNNVGTELQQLQSRLDDAYGSIKANSNNPGVWIPYRTWFGPRDKDAVFTYSQEIRNRIDNHRVEVACVRGPPEIEPIVEDKKITGYRITIPRTKTDIPAFDLFVLGLAETVVPDGSKPETKQALNLTLLARKADSANEYQPHVYALFFATVDHLHVAADGRQVLLYAINRRLSRLRYLFAQSNCPLRAIIKPSGPRFIEREIKCRIEGTNSDLLAQNRFSTDGRDVVMAKNFVIPAKQQNSAGGWNYNRLLSIYASDLFLMQYSWPAKAKNEEVGPFSIESLPSALPSRITRFDVTNYQTRKAFTDAFAGLFNGQQTRVAKFGEETYFKLLGAPNVRSTQQIISEFNVLKGTRFCIARIEAQANHIRKSQLDIVTHIGRRSSDKVDDLNSLPCDEPIARPRNETG
ncbi:MAG: hypothetical protein AAFN50_10795, partial [Pseudomonadota bacterium]